MIGQVVENLRRGEAVAPELRDEVLIRHGHLPFRGVNTPGSHGTAKAGLCAKNIRGINVLAVAPAGCCQARQAAPAKAVAENALAFKGDRKNAGLRS